jgi:hypothetical protein
LNVRCASHGYGGTGGGLDQRGTRGRQRSPGGFFVACHHHRDVQRVERAGRFQRLQRQQHHDIATLHVDDAGAARRLRIDSRERLEGAVGLEDRIEMADQQYLRRRSGMRRDQMPGALPRRAIHPAHREAERFQLGPEHGADSLDAGDVHRAAVDVDDTLEQRDRFVGVRVDVGGGGSFL